MELLSCLLKPLSVSALQTARLPLLFSLSLFAAAVITCHDHPPLLHLRSDPRSIRWSDPPNIRALKPVRYPCASDPRSRSSSRQSFCVKGGSERNICRTSLLSGTEPAPGVLATTRSRPRRPAALRAATRSRKGDAFPPSPSSPAPLTGRVTPVVCRYDSFFFRRPDPTRHGDIRRPSRAVCL